MDKAQEQQQIMEVCRRFDLKGEYRYYEQLNSGHINTTYCVYFFRDGEIKDYILQRVNTYVFKDPYSVMENISSVTEYIRAKIKATGISAKRFVLHYSKTPDGAYYTLLPDGGFWRCCRYIDGSISPEDTNDLFLIEQSGKAFGEFQMYLADYPMESLNIVIPHFHNTIRRFDALRTAVKENLAGRLNEVKDLLEGFYALEEIATYPYRLQQQGVLPLRVTHNDTKTSNVLFDAETHERLSVIDLDTVMPGLVAFDFGDAIRMAAATTPKEDEPDLARVAVDMEKFEAFTRGFVNEVKGAITQAEMDSLAYGALAITTELGTRFLADYLDGDKYFRVHYPDQNLARAKRHLVLAQDMLKRLDDMRAVVKKYSG
ncbi:MAG: aminoglycoside phosphotransferase family protein [Clostridiales bacterium]|nr:aminoglycoside phosphotransferase family protein [Clostridiales bacterium]